MIPYKVDVVMERHPWANWVLLAIMAFVFVLELTMDSHVFLPMILAGWNPVAMLTSQFLHGDVLHLIGNMIFLWVFGNAVCAKIGNLWFAPVFLGMGVLAGIIHLIFDGRPAIGASGAINGVIGVYLVLYPLNAVGCFYWLFGLVPRSFTVSGYWMILLWLGFDIWGAVTGSGNTAYYAHLGGFAGGMAAALLLLKSGRIVMGPHDVTIADAFRGRRLGSRYKRLKAQRSRTSEPVPSAPVPVRPSSRPLPPTVPVPDKITAVCSCGVRVNVPAVYAGRRVKCPRCGSAFAVPE